MRISKLTAGAFILLILSGISVAYLGSSAKERQDLSGLLISNLPVSAGEYYVSQAGACLGKAEIFSIKESGTAYSVIFELDSGDIVDLKVYLNAAGQMFRSELAYGGLKLETNKVAPIIVENEEGGRAAYKGFIEFEETETAGYRVFYTPRQLGSIRLPEINFPEDISDISFDSSENCSKTASIRPEWLLSLKRLKR